MEEGGERKRREKKDKFFLVMYRRNLTLTGPGVYET